MSRYNNTDLWHVALQSLNRSEGRIRPQRAEQRAKPINTKPIQDLFINLERKNREGECSELNAIV